MVRSDGQWPALPTGEGSRAARRRRLLPLVALAVAAVCVVVLVRRGDDAVTAATARTAATAAPTGAGAAAVTPTGEGPSVAAGATVEPSDGPTDPPAGPTSDPATDPSTDSSAPSAGGGDGGPVTLAFGGDVHFEGAAAAAADGDLGSARTLLARADLAVVNLETAVTERGTAEPKKYSFRAPARVLTGLRRAGVDAVSLANNHGMDYGRTGLDDTLRAGVLADLPVLGAGYDAEQAHRPLRVVRRGVSISVLAATDVLDYLSWVAGPDRPGLASAKDPRLLLDAVRAEARRSDVVAVFLHWGRELVVCPTARQRELARLLSDAGADLVVGSHAHVVQPEGRVGRTAVKYGLGNFVWYSRGGVGAQTGVFTATVDRTGVRSTAWAPATITAGRPQLLRGSALTQRRADEARRSRSCSP
jgi:poly-gamma-glutamate synthesis protein (capsule biosynthesis protein)